MTVARSSLLLFLHRSGRGGSPSTQLLTFHQTRTSTLPVVLVAVVGKRSTTFPIRDSIGASWGHSLYQQLVTAFLSPVFFSHSFVSQTLGPGVKSAPLCRLGFTGFEVVPGDPHFHTLQFRGLPLRSKNNISVNWTLLV
jgi:hypothetical protein